MKACFLLVLAVDLSGAPGPMVGSAECWGRWSGTRGAGPARLRGSHC